MVNEWMDDGVIGALTVFGHSENIYNIIAQYTLFIDDRLADNWVFLLAYWCKQSYLASIKRTSDMSLLIKWSVVHILISRFTMGFKIILKSYCYSFILTTNNWHPVWIHTNIFQIILINKNFVIEIFIVYVYVWEDTEISCNRSSKVIQLRIQNDFYPIVQIDPLSIFTNVIII